MSHYTVAVFTKNFSDDIDDLLAPFDENLKVEPYISQTKEQFIRRKREDMQKTFDGLYAQWQRNPYEYEKDCLYPQHIEYLRSLPELMRRSDDEIYQAEIKGYEPDEIAGDGGIISTCNPESKWDWYVIGGRWSGMLILKEAVADELRDVSLLTCTSENQNHARVSEVDFERQALFSTFAVITPDGVWQAPGKVGLFGISSETSEQLREWELTYYDRFIKPAIENDWYITVVDCHI